ncbi:MAG: NAD(P)/FAD-dependent oxidoreductase [Flavobacteriales bacterium]
MERIHPPNQESAVIRVIGQGLAGSVLALLLMNRGYKVHVYDNGYRTSSSIIAAGMWNPLSFVNLKRSWLAHELLPALEKTYPLLESMLGTSFFHPKRLLRVFPDAGAANRWEEKSDHPETAPFMEQEILSDTGYHFRQPFGHGVVRGAGWLDLPQFMQAARTYFEERNSFTQAEIDSIQITNWLQEGDWVFQCTGWKPMADSFWKDVPIHTNKGQVLTMRIDGLNEDYMCNFGKFTIPLGNSMFRVGSTYEHGALDSLPSAVADEIIEDVKRSVKHAFTIEDHKAGFRPTTIDRQPVLGMHDEHARLGIFNGFGSRGVMLVPFFANQLIEHLIYGTSLIKEVDWRRFEERRLKSQ